MNLDDAQKQKVASWLEQGLRLSEIQSKLASEFGMQLTYMELRFLLDDLKLKPKEKEVLPSPPAEIGQRSTKPQSPLDAKKAPDLLPEQDIADADEFAEEAPQPAGAGKVSVTVDRIARPGAIVSGGVTFSDGNSAQWSLDQLGRLGLAPKQQGYRPSQTDLLS